MSSKDKEAQISKSKFKLFFKTSKNAAGSTGERSLRPEIERELRPETPVAQRCKTLKELGDQHLYNLNLEDSSIIKLWDLTKDLIVPNKPAEYRQTTLIFYKKLIHSQYKNLNLLREHFFLVIQNHEVPEDLKHRLELLDTLTDNGKDIKNFEEKIGKFLLLWIPAITEANLLRPYLDMLVNLIKWNAAHLDTDIVVGIVQNACHLSCTVEDNEIGLQCLTILELVMSYTIFPCEPLPQCVVTLCRTVNHVPYCQASWKIMKNLLGTQLGFYSMKMMCNILNDSTLYEDQQLLRGAVFHLNMNIFASNVSFQVSAMFYASTVLTSFLHALESRHVIVTYEVILSARKVVNKYKTELPEIIWDRICDILSAIANNIDHYEQTNLNKDTLQHLQVNFHENVDFIEKLLQDEKTKILANFDRIYDLIERVAESRPEASVLHLIEYRASKVTATRPEWLQLLNNFVRRFYKMSNTNIRVKTIQSLVRIMDLNRSSYEEEILERVIIPHFSQITSEPDVQIRVAVAKALVDFARHCDTKRCGELLDILEKIMNRPFEQYQAAIATGAIDTNEPFFINESEILDAITAVDGLIDVFIIKLYRLPSCHAIKIFNILVSHLEMHYQKPKVFELVNCVRFKIFNWMLKARANGSYHIGYPDAANNDVIKFSYYLGIDSSLPLYGMTHQHQRQQVGSQLLPQEIIPSAHFTTISIRRACKIIVRCLESDRDFQIFQLVIKELPKVLQNKALIQGNDIEALANALFKIFTDKSAHLSYKPTTDEFYALVLPAIASLVIYHQSIAPSYQASVTKALSAGIFSGSANVCINAMTIMILEMKETFMRLLPDILLQMSKMSDTTAVAIPVLEFLSILSRLNNNIFTNFITRQYMYVFAISLPYTKPHRYDHYTVSLAHHVIAGWFLKVKLEYRKNIVAYIISSIQSNASMLYEDINKLTRNIQRQDLNSLNEDSSNRKRSTSLTERGSRNSNVRNDSDMRPLMNDSLKSFHTELAETCIDFLARHTFSPCSALPKRLPAVDYLLKDGLSQTWLVGNNLVTITTAGCPSAPTRNGLCDRCLQIGKATQFTAKSETAGTTAPPPLSPEIGATTTTGTVGAEAAANIERRYTKVSLQHSSGNESAGSTDLTSSTSTSSSHHAASHASTQRQTSNSSTASFEALSRRGSNPDADLHSAAGGSMLGTSMQQLSTPISGSSSQLQVQQPICIRSCTGWAEIHVRRPTGNISWITRIQNPIANDCFGHDMPFSNVASLFLPTLHGGVFGPDFVEDAKFLSPRVSIGPEISSMSNAADGAVGGATSSRESLASNAEEQRVTAAKVVAKVRALQRQEEISSASASTAAIDIPKAVKRVGKEALSGSVSDGEADEEGAAFDDGTSKSRNPVRRVNSSPEMSSSWRSSFLANKPRPLSKELSNTEITGAAAEVTSLDVNSSISGSNEQLQKKKTVGYSKDMRVSCEAIPEEIAGSTPPSLTDSLKASNLQQPESSATDDKTTTASDFTLVQKSLDLPNRESTVQVPLKQHSADDATQQMSTLAVGGGGPAVIPVQTSLSATSLKITPKAAAAAQKITAKPPLSPAPLSPRMLAKNSAHHLGLAKSSSSGGANNNGGNGNNNGDNNVGGGGGSNSSDYNNGDGIRGRSKTISVVREVNGKSRPASSNFRFGGQNKPPQINTKLCMNPSFVFMQLYHTGQQQVTDVPIKVPPENMNAVSLLDLTPPFETHTIGVLYVGQGQCNNEVEMLRNSYGSARYVEFLRSIGTLVSLKSAKENNLFIMMETDGPDGKFAYIWKDDIVQVTFHVATLMPTNLKKDPNCYEKKKHIGNDYVSIIYNESGEEYNLNTIGTQFNYACVIVQPLELNTNRIYVKARPEIAKYVCHPDAKIVSDSSAPLLARQMALHANLAALVYQSVKKKNPYASNWLERLRLIKRLRTKLENQSIQQPVGSAGDIDDNSADPLKRQNTNRDFTKYT